MDGFGLRRQEDGRRKERGSEGGHVFAWVRTPVPPSCSHAAAMGPMNMVSMKLRSQLQFQSQAPASQKRQRPYCFRARRRGPRRLPQPRAAASPRAAVTMSPPAGRAHRRIAPSVAQSNISSFARGHCFSLTPPSIRSEQPRRHPCKPAPNNRGDAAGGSLAWMVEQLSVAAEKPDRRERSSRSTHPASDLAFYRFTNEPETRGEQFIAGWLAWLTAIAREAINDSTVRRTKSFEKIDKIMARRALAAGMLI